MNKMKNKPKPKKSTKEKTTPKRKGIPKEELDEFLEGKIPPEDKAKITKISADNVFEDNYRINVWMQEYHGDCVCPQVWIGYSCFVKYHEGMIINKTVEPKPKKKGFFDD
tara:strand:+ start:2200 stop:2529 length:330 start_codon:yes stop_codon:yes gene_type:complete